MDLGRKRVAQYLQGREYASNLEADQGDTPRDAAQTLTFVQEQMDFMKNAAVADNIPLVRAIMRVIAKTPANPWVHSAPGAWLSRGDAWIDANRHIAGVLIEERVDEAMDAYMQNQHDLTLAINSAMATLLESPEHIEATGEWMTAAQARNYGRESRRRRIEDWREADNEFREQDNIRHRLQMEAWADQRDRDESDAN